MAVRFKVVRFKAVRFKAVRFKVVRFKVVRFKVVRFKVVRFVNSVVLPVCTARTVQQHTECITRQGKRSAALQRVTVLITTPKPGNVAGRPSLRFSPYTGRDWKILSSRLGRKVAAITP